MFKAGYRNIGLKKAGATKEIWLTKEVNEAIAYRDRLKPDRHQKPNEFTEADTSVKTLMTEDKRNIWRRKVEETKNATAMWNMVRNLQNGPRISSKGIALIHNESLCKTDRERESKRLYQLLRVSQHPDVTEGGQVAQRSNK